MQYGSDSKKRYLTYKLRDFIPSALPWCQSSQLSACKTLAQASSRGSALNVPHITMSLTPDRHPGQGCNVCAGLGVLIQQDRPRLIGVSHSDQATMSTSAAEGERR